MDHELNTVLAFEEDTQKGKFLTFALGKEEYGVEIKYVTEIIGIQAITEIPEMPDYIKGIINLRGKIIPIMDVRLRFSKEFKGYNDRTCIIVIELEDLSIGLVVDCVSEVLPIPEENISKPPNFQQGFQNKYIKGIGKVGQEVKLLLDCNMLLDIGEKESLQENLEI